MIMSIKDSELILNSDGSVYHLHLKPKDLASKVITVGDPDRVDQVSAHFDTIDFRQHKREFKTHTGTLRNQRITVISTGIGSDNIDIVLNELDALVNIDFESRRVKSEITSLKIIRIGTSGALQNEIPVDSFLLSTHGLDLNGMLQAYKTQSIQNKAFEQAFLKYSNWKKERAKPVLVEGDKSIENQLSSKNILKGITATCGGFYAPQGRKLRLTPSDSKFLKNLQNFTFKGYKITNFEMETSAIFGLSKLLGHQACSMNAILANRINGTFSKSPEKTIDALIQYTLDKLID
jgi:uridine phosphorylase